LLVDCHSHVWAYPGHLSDEFVNEANARSRGHALDLHIPPETHKQAMAGVDKVIVFGLRAFHSGLWVPNEYIAAYAASDPDKVIGFGAIDPMVDPVEETLEEIVRLKLRGVKLGPIYQKHPNLYSDISALHYRPWQFYNALILAKEYGVLDKILFGSDYPFTTPEAQIDGLRNINHFTEGTNLPRLTSEEIERLIYSPTLTCLGLESA
jgi:predicted TIM-barrel fold metal-dependent hydrolase